MVVKKKQKDDDEGGISAAPSDQTAGGSLLSDVDVTFTEVACTTFDYNGKVKDDDGNIVEVPAIFAKLVTDDGKEQDTYWACGYLDKLVPRDDGSTFDPAEGSAAKGLPSNSNGGTLFRSMGDAGYPFTHDEGLPDDYKPKDIARLLDGMRAHIMRVEQKKKGGLAASERKRKYPDEVTVVTEIHSYPWDEKKGKGKAKAAAPKGRAKVEEEEEAGDDPGDLAAEVVGKLLASPKHKKGISTDDISELFWEASKTHPKRKAMIAAVQEDGYFEGRDEFELDEDGLITLA